MKVIGLTGGIGTGKSTVAKFLAEMGAVILDADKVGHEVLKPGTQGWQEVVAAFGNQILNPDGTINRLRLGEIVFESTDSLHQLNRITHTRIHDLVKSQIEEYRRQGVAVLILEAPLLLEANWTSIVDEVWVTVSSEPTVLKRLRERTGLSQTESLARIRSQLSAEERTKRADVVINTDCKLNELRDRVIELWSMVQG
jgi:dephospho-CoA kinase